MSANLEIHRTVRAISIDLDYAIAFYENANAVYHATGKRVRDLPITVDKLRL